MDELELWEDDRSEQRDRIKAAFNGLPPYEPGELEEAGKDWRDRWEDDIPLEHRKELDQWYYDEAREEREEIGRGLNMALFGKSAAQEGPAPLPSCQESDDYMPQWKRWAYFIKAMLCYAFGLFGHSGYDYIEVVTTQYTGSPHGWSWSARYVIVGEGLFRNWFIDLIHDGESSY